MCQIAVRWLIQQDTVCSVIIGVKTIAQLEDNMGAGKGWELTKDQVCQPCILRFRIAVLTR